jgi:hypothetical protein
MFTRLEGITVTGTDLTCVSVDEVLILILILHNVVSHCWITPN